MKNISVLIVLLFAIFPIRSIGQNKSDFAAQLPIVAWYGIPGDEVSVERFKELKEAGFTINFRSFDNAGQVAEGLEAAQKAGIKLIISCPELHDEAEKTVRRFKNHPAVAGYFLRDEPVVADFPGLAAWAKKIQSVDSKKFCYLNLFPTGGEQHLNALGVKSYKEYVTRFNEEVPLQFLSFDHYPVLGNNVLKEEWYENLEDFSEVARNAGKDFWAFALATKHGPYPLPTKAALRLQLYSDLAYGAQGLQYFTYWTPSGDSFYDYQFGPIGLDGKRTEIYDLVKGMNAEIYNIAGIFKGAKVLSVRHTGTKIPRGTVRLTTLPENVKVLDTHGAGAVISVLENKGKKFLVIVNRHLADTMELTFYAAPSVKRVLKDGSLVSADTYTSTLRVDPGDILIYLLKQ